MLNEQSGTRESMPEENKKYMKQYLGGMFMRYTFGAFMAILIGGLGIMTPFLADTDYTLIFVGIGTMMLLGGIQGLIIFLPQNRQLKNDTYKWQYGTVTSKKTNLMGGRIRRYQMYIDNQRCLPVTLKDFTATAEGDQAIIISFLSGEEDEDSGERIIKTYAMRRM